MQPKLSAIIVHRGSSLLGLDSLLRWVSPNVSDVLFVDASGGDRLDLQFPGVRYFMASPKLNDSDLLNDCFSLLVTPFCITFDSGERPGGAGSWACLYKSLDQWVEGDCWSLPVLSNGEGLVHWDPRIFHRSSKWIGGSVAQVDGMRDIKRLVAPLNKTPQYKSPGAIKLAIEATTSFKTYSYCEYGKSCANQGLIDEAFGSYLYAIEHPDFQCGHFKHRALSGLLRQSSKAGLAKIAVDSIVDHLDIVTQSSTLNYLLGTAYLSLYKESADSDHRVLSEGFLSQAMKLGDTPWYDGHLIGSGSSLAKNELLALNEL